MFETILSMLVCFFLGAVTVSAVLIATLPH